MSVYISDKLNTLSGLQVVHYLIHCRDELKQMWQLLNVITQYYIGLTQSVALIGSHKVKRAELLEVKDPIQICFKTNKNSSSSFKFKFFVTSHYISIRQ